MTEVVAAWARAEAEKRYPATGLYAGDEFERQTLIAGHVEGVRLLADRLLSDEVIEAVARQVSPNPKIWKIFESSARQYIAAALAAVTEGSK
jgi:hypothetical protein